MTELALTGMESTMREIEEQDAPTNLRENLQAEIENLKKSIKTAQEILTYSYEPGHSYTPVSPEKANELKRDVVFLKKDLENKKAYFKSLSEHI